MELFHVVGDDWREGQPLQSLHRRLGDEAYDVFVERWPDAGDLGQYHAHEIFFYETHEDALDHAANFGGRVVKVDSAKVNGLMRDKLEVPIGREGFWSTQEDVPPDAILLLGRLGI